MRILIMTGIFPPDIGGPATYVPQIARALAGRGHEITVLTLCDHMDHEGKTDHFRIVRLPRQTFKPWRWLRIAVMLIRLGWHADVLFVNGLAAETVLVNMLLRKPMVQKVVGDVAWERATNWGWTKDNFEEFQKSHKGLKVELLKTFRSWWICRADTVIVPSRYLAQWVAKWGVREGKITVVYNAVEPVNCIEPARVPLTTVVKVVTVGRLIPWKNVDRVIQVVSQFGDAGLVIVGDGPERECLRALASALGSLGRTFFAGQRSRTEALRLMAACDLFVLNSTYEGFPHAVLEAMSVGLPIVATAVGGTPEVVRDEDNGMLIPVMDDQALSEALLQLVSSPSERRRLADTAQHTIGSFSLGRMVEDTGAVLSKVTNRQKKR